MLNSEEFEDLQSDSQIFKNPMHGNETNYSKKSTTADNTFNKNIDAIGKKSYFYSTHCTNEKSGRKFGIFQCFSCCHTCKEKSKVLDSNSREIKSDKYTTTHYSEKAKNSRYVTENVDSQVVYVEGTLY